METVIKPVNGNQFTWIDLCRPTAHDLMAIMDQYDLHKTAVLDSLDPQHLPKLERFKNGVFLIVRLYDSAAHVLEDDLQKMTSKLSIYLNAKTLITIRRQGQGCIDELVERWKSKGEVGNLDSVAHPLNEILDTVLTSYMDPLENCQSRLDRLERLTFQDTGFQLLQAEDAYSLIAKTSVIKRMLSMSVHIIDRIDYIPDASRPYYNDIQEDGESLLFWVQDIQENTNRILQLQISLEAQRTHEASQRTNEIMRFLTVFSILFMPLNFIAGVYGMNFNRMPLLQHPWGFWLSLFLMAASTCVILLWFRRQGWLHRNAEPDALHLTRRFLADALPDRRWLPNLAGMKRDP
ncbi:MAG TPA: CorA family divalent cation transporter [Oligoflexus sp.]|uniref:CorA family divalent cation transporter n=1 Tax=Oligoflexus sp. TaxID=1971216 RepID=UPI002D4DF054|nr:CorA family divalent cation transporter [Oligoflexus sp.]HYX37171.1 CorA family divalent cation transporter [Oligoflexus sp.]